MAGYNILSLKQPGLPATCPNQVCKWRLRCVVAKAREPERPTYVPQVAVNFVQASEPTWLTCKSFEAE